MKIVKLGLVGLWVAGAVGQQTAECTRELARTDECADVINANACYNKYRFRDTQTLSCIDGKDNKERSRKACKCCSCVGAVMCSWVDKNRLCTAT
ncbi:hypothetical protein BS50DRAFT_547000 [Corynespora cassiicola Philippines]|uniref:Uncharacterized protein n=1 Tax=Corynespora cassiicola Philippines TaxID=1448308 RepID=A0A2T2P1M0_CORCC|nr:hypothetical protein BS50DRAFT_547000 [Corynespora cassiicola Philippines]